MTAFPAFGHSQNACEQRSTDSEMVQRPIKNKTVHFQIIFDHTTPRCMFERLAVNCFSDVPELCLRSSFLQHLCSSPCQNHVRLTSLSLSLSSSLVRPKKEEALEREERRRLQLASKNDRERIFASERHTKKWQNLGERKFRKCELSKHFVFSSPRKIILFK